MQAAFDRAAQRGGPVSLAVQAIGRAATLALYDELALSPKPGLVTLSDNGSHADMTAQTFMRSLFALRGYFVQIAALGARRAPFRLLERCGIDAEARMLAATGGVNTHRGAIFMLGLLCASAGAVSVSGERLRTDLLRQALQETWGEDLRERAQRVPRLPGALAARRHGLRSASSEAAAGFPVLFDVAVPAMRSGCARGMPRAHALLDTLFRTMAVLDDSNLAHRGGMEGLCYARSAAQAWLDAGGSMRRGGIAHAERIAAEFVQRRLSPGGAADTLAAVCWMQRMGVLDMQAQADPGSEVAAS